MLAVALAAAMAGVLTVAAQAAAPRPNILVVVTDDLGWGQLGFNGGTEVGTPNLDRIANEGVKLTQFYVSPGCSPTRSALLTGRHYWKTGGVAESATRGLDVGVLLDERLMAEALRDAGYETWAIGKWHLGQWHSGHLPLQRGFDHHYGMYSGFITYGSHRHLGKLDWHRNGRPVVESGYSTFLKAEEAVQLIGRHDGRDPFFLYLAFNAAHGPDGAPEEYVERYADTAEPVQRAQVKALDDALGWVIDALEDKGMLDDTLVVFLNDNGGTARAGANAPYRGLKGAFHEGGIRVPAAIRWPGRIPAGSESDALLHVVDVFPTLAGLAGASTTDGLPLDGLDAWQAIAAGAESPRQELAHSRKVMRVGDWKLLEPNGVSYGRRWATQRQLYNIAEDPYEETNLAGSEPAKVAELRTRLAHHRAAARDPAPAAQMPEGRVTYGFDENAAYGAAVERAYTELQAGNPGPMLVRLEAAGDRVKLVYDEPVDTDSVPPESAFRVVTTPGYAAVEVTDVEASGSDVMLTLASRLAPDTTVGMTYDVPDSGAIRDADGLEAVGTTWQTVMASSVDPVWLSTATVEARGEYLGYSSIAHPDLGAVADHAFDFGEGAPYQVQIVLAYSGGVIFQVRNRGDAIAGLVLEWAGETLPLADAAWNANWDRYTWSQAWLDANAPSLNASAYAATLPDGSTTEVCLRYAEQTCPVASTAGGSGTASADATLSTLALTGIDIGTFAAGTTSYTAAVAHAVVSTQVTASANPSGASVTITDGDGSTDGTSRTVALAEGSNAITVTVTAEDGTTTQTYTVTVTREAASTDATLSTLALSGIDIGTFAAGTTSYTASVGNAVASTQVAATANDAGASVTIADGDGSTDGTSRTVALAEGSNAITVTVTAEDGETTETYTVTVTREAASTDAALTAGFERVPDGHDGSSRFELRVRFSEELAASSGRKVARAISISGATRGTVLRVGDGRDLFKFQLTPSGDGDVTVSLSAPSGCGESNSVCTTDGRALSNAPSVTVEGPEAASTDATLSSLTLSGIDIGTFAAATTSYTATVAHDVASTQVAATANDAGASVTITDSDGSTDGASRTVALAEGANTITVTVTAEDGETTQTYTVTVTREAASTDAALSSLALTGVDIGTFAAGTKSYAASVGNAVASTQVTASANHSGASVTIADGDGSTDGTSRTVALAEGANTITVTVTAEDGETTQAYTVTVTRTAASADATLSALTLSGIDIGTFAAGTKSYSASVGNAVASTQVTATTNQAGASVTITDGDGSTDGASRTVALAEGANTITVTVTAEDGVTTQTYTVTVTREAAGTALTAWFESVPDGHDGSSPFDLRVRFSEELAQGSRRKLQSALAVSRASLGRVSRVGDTRDLFKFPLTPSDDGDVEVKLRASSDCNRSDSLCTADGQALSNTLSVTVKGPSRVNANANGPIVTLQWGSPRDSFGSPAVPDYGVQVNGNARAVVSAELSGSTARLTLESPVVAGDTVTVAYLGSAMHPLAEATGQVRAEPWDGLVAENLTGIEPLATRAASVEWRSVDPLAAADDAVRLDASGLGLSEMWGVERLTALERLDLSGNAVSDLSLLAGLANLRDLDLSGNEVTDLWPLAGLYNLERLDLSGNAISDLSLLTGLANLRDLDLSGNEVTDLWSLAGLYNLERLNLSGNGLTEVQALAGLPNLKVLLLDGNDVADAWPLAGLGTLENLGLGGNRISDVTALRDLQQLRRLDLSGNPAADISPLGDIGSLVWLALPGDRVGASAETLRQLTRLRWVWSGSARTARNDASIIRQ